MVSSLQTKAHQIELIRNFIQESLGHAPFITRMHVLAMMNGGDVKYKIIGAFNNEADREWMVQAFNVSHHSKYRRSQKWVIFID